MGDLTDIEWAMRTFNAWYGCQNISDACDHCYAEGWAKRSGLVQWGPHADRRRTSADYWKKPLRWNREAEASGTPQSVFCNSLADVFDNHRSIPQAWRDDLWALIEATPWLIWKLLTKRPQNAARMVPERWMRDGWPANVWLGVTAENQTEADRRVPVLLSLPVRTRFLSCEPLLGPVDLQPWLDWPEINGELPDGTAFGCWGCDVDACCKCPKHKAHYECEEGPRDETGCPEYVHCERITLDQVIVGGESGHGARPMHPDWARDLRDQCAAAGTAFFFKQWGEYVPVYDRDRDDPDWQRCDLVVRQTPKGRWLNRKGGHGFHGDRVVRVDRVGKKQSGRLLDGVLHEGMPEARHG